jgi:hypothetical protein
MLRFRPTAAAASGPPPELLAIGQMIDEAVQPGHFFVAPSLRLRWEPARTETVPWEIFRGHLLDPAQTRQSRTFLSWHIRLAEQGAEPLLSVHLDVHALQIHVTRGLLCHAWEGYDAGGGEIHSRQVQRWTRELVGTIELERFANLDDMRDELICLLWQAVVGTSRLPLTSVEAPLPAFIFGQLVYVYRADLNEDQQREPMQSCTELIERGLQPELAWREQIKLLETVLRAFSPECVYPEAELFVQHWQKLGWGSAEQLQRRRGVDVSVVFSSFLRRWLQLGGDSVDLLRLLRDLFNEVSLSPYTQFVNSSLTFVEYLDFKAEVPTAVCADFFGYLLRQLGRHLSAYDLVTFHHRGANYPDILLLDAVLKWYCVLLETDLPFYGDTPLSRRLRRALRQGCLLRRQYEGHLVPVVPTSPGENARVWPNYPHLPEEQLLQPLRRPCELFKDEPLLTLLGPRGRQALRQSVADLAVPAERAELGMAVFIDRPLGYAKLAGEPDQTPLLAHEAYSETLAQRRLRELEKLCQELGFEMPAVGSTALNGLQHRLLAEPSRPTAALADVRKVADDFVIVRTLHGGLEDLWRAFDFGPLAARYGLDLEPRLVLQMAMSGGMVLMFFDEELWPFLEMEADLSQGYARRAGVEFPAAGLRVLAVRPEGDAGRRDVSAEDVRVPARAFRSS